MNLSNQFSNIHWLPVIIVTVCSFMLGVAWHSSFLFGKIWTKENNRDKIKIKVNIPIVFGGTAVMHFLAIAALSAVLSEHGAINGLLGGLLISLLWILPAIYGTYVFANRSLKLLAIDSGMYIVLFSLSGLVLGIW
jgi:hypothetical protein